MGTVLLSVGLALILALLIAIHRRLDHLPARLAAVARRERAQDATAAQGALQEAAAARVGALVTGLRSYHEEVAANFRGQVADANLRARVAERRATDAGTALSAASALLREVRAMHDDLAERLLRAPGPPASPPGEPAAAELPDPEVRVTVEMPPDAPAVVAAGLGPRPPATAPRRATMAGIAPCAVPSGADGDRPSDDEPTRVGSRAALAKTLASMPAVGAPGERPSPPVGVEERRERDKAGAP